jgi:hypothetical protein
MALKRRCFYGLLTCRESRAFRTWNRVHHQGVSTAAFDPNRSKLPCGIACNLRAKWHQITKLRDYLGTTRFAAAGVISLSLGFLHSHRVQASRFLLSVTYGTAKANPLA